MDPMATVLVVQVHCNHAFATLDITGVSCLTHVRTLTSVSLAPTIAFHRPDVSTHQGPIGASALPSLVGPLTVDLVTILTNAGTQTCVIHRLRASIFKEDLNAVVTWVGEDKAHILSAMTSMNVLKGQIGDFRFCSIIVSNFVNRLSGNCISKWLK